MTTLPQDLTSWLVSLFVSVIDSLRFPTLSQRQEDVKQAHPGTFRWIYENKSSNRIAQSSKYPACNFYEWLQNGSGIYWISGKAGSGKSTLMKHLYRNEKTISILNAWAGERQLHTAIHFFWNIGTGMQKSQLGLLQTLLCNILDKDPALILKIWPYDSQEWPPDRNWTLNKLLDIFKRLSADPAMRHAFCFFIDGLDEYEGDHNDIIELVNVLAESKAIKICISSRPWIVFNAAYGEHNTWKLRLQEFNKSDIRRFASESLAQGASFSKFDDTSIEWAEFVDEIVDRADGVFLWAYLVVRSLRRGITNLDTMTELQGRLRDIPTELEAYFQRILDAVDKVYHKQAARLYQIFTASLTGRLDVLDLWWFDKQTSEFGVDTPVPDFDSVTAEACRRIKTRVLARCQDLIEFTSNHTAQFLHRTVKDFLETKDVQMTLKARAGHRFDADRYLVIASLIRFKMVNPLQSNAQYAPKTPTFAKKLLNGPQKEDKPAKAPTMDRPTLENSPTAKTFLDAIWYHARRMESREQPHYTLLLDLDKYISLLCSADKTHPFDPDSYTKGLVRVHRPGWLADEAAMHGVQEFLAQLNSALHSPPPQAPLTSTSTSPSPSIPPPSPSLSPLYTALEHMHSPHRHSQLRHLLTLGADPNERMGESTVWKSYVASERRAWCARDWNKSTLAQDTPAETDEVVQLMLAHGADPGVLEETSRVVRKSPLDASGSGFVRVVGMLQWPGAWLWRGG